MSTSNLIRWSGLAALVGGVLFIVLDILDFLLYGNLPYSEAATASSFTIVQAAFIIAVALTGLGLVGFYAHQAQETGSLGLVAFVVSFLGLILAAGVVWGEAFFGAWLAGAAPQLLQSNPSGAFAAGIFISYFLYTFGWVLFGLASFRGGVFPRGAAVVLIVGALMFVIISLLELPFESIVLGAALAWMGYAQWSGASEPVLIAESAH
jgi:hypothetical protein